MLRRHLDRVFMLNEVQWLEGSDLPLVQVARRLGFPDSMLSRWRNQVRVLGSAAFDEAGRAERSEVVRLRRENRHLRRELGMVKKTLGLLERLEK